MRHYIVEFKFSHYLEFHTKVIEWMSGRNHIKIANFRTKMIGENAENDVLGYEVYGITEPEALEFKLTFSEYLYAMKAHDGR